MTKNHSAIAATRLSRLEVQNEKRLFQQNRPEAVVREPTSRLFVSATAPQHIRKPTAKTSASIVHSKRKCPTAPASPISITPSAHLIAGARSTTKNAPTMRWTWPHPLNDIVPAQKPFPSSCHPSNTARTTSSLTSGGTERSASRENGSRRPRHSFTCLSLFDQIQKKTVHTMSTSVTSASCASACANPVRPRSVTHVSARVLPISPVYTAPPKKVTKERGSPVRRTLRV